MHCMRRYSPEGLEKHRLANRESFLRDANEKFGGRFDYTQTIYVRQKAKVTIRCPTHGAFGQTPDKHLQSAHGCPQCAVAARSRGRIDDGSKRFSASFTKRFGNRLELVSPYVSVKAPIRVRCLAHGVDFETTPANINISKYGCLQCVREKTSKQNRSTTKEFIRRATVRFADQFDLTKVDYKTNAAKVNIGCPIHGEFQITPASFLKSAHGCPKCASQYIGYAANRIQRLESGTIEGKPTTLALMTVEVFGITAFKLGITSRQLIERYREFLRNIIFETTLDELSALKLERRLHGKYFRFRDVRIFLAGLRSGKRWSGDSEIYKEECLPNLLDDLKQGVAAIEGGVVDYWATRPELTAPVLNIRSVRMEAGIFNESKPVIRLDTLAIYPSATAAAAAVGSSQGLVSMVCRGLRGQTKGVQFAYVKDYEQGSTPVFTSGIKGSNHSKARAVRSLDTGNIYTTITEAAAAVGINSSKITQVCKGKRKTAGGQRWEYVKVKD